VDRHPDDFYATPRWATVAILDALDARGALTAAAGLGRILEPSCGDGAILDVLAERVSQSRLYGVEIDTARAQATRRRFPRTTVAMADYLRWTPHPGASPAWIIGNPPFKHAQEFVEHSLSFAPADCRVTLLLRLAFLASKRRASLYAPGAGFAALHVLPRRPSFTPDRGTDRYDYGWFTWQKGFRGDARIFRL
jgi:hypothetical protein